MDATVVNSPVFNDYWNVIKNWSDEMKIALISKISTSMIHSAHKTKAKTLGDFFGSMKDDPYYPSAKDLKEIVRDEDEDITKFMI